MKSDANGIRSASESDSAERRIALLCLLCGIPVFMIVAHFAGWGRGRAAGVCVAVDALVMVLRWEARRMLRFWLAILLILLIQMMVIFLVPFGDQSLPAYGLLPAALGIYLVDEGIIYLFGARSADKHPESSSPD
ncbi:hypothetical protein [Terriglobus tenax]|uniref:hypothetical protein n=1 Tax=Terriglobus tenax TaxID=1111115 RepID=UPI0021DF4C73|nr:hypothetical protein [Terriglobus tenax]